MRKRRLTSDHLRGIAQAWLDAERSYGDLAREFGCSRATVMRAVKRFVSDERREQVLAERRAVIE